MESVPCVTTTPSTPSGNTRIAPASAVISENANDAPETCRKSTTSTATPLSPSPGTPPTNSRADNAGTTPPSADLVMAIVPPRAKTTTRQPT